METTELVVEGEFLSHAQMEEKGLSEYSGIACLCFLFLVFKPILCLFLPSNVCEATDRRHQEALQDQPQEADEA